MTDNKKTVRICSSCKETWDFPSFHTYGYETEEEKQKWLCWH